MEIFAQIVMLVWIPAVLILFAVLPPHRAVIVAILGAWLFLPMAAYNLPYLPDYTKMSATCAGIFLAALLFDAKRLLQYSPSRVDLPVVLMCFCPLVSSLSNGLGLWDGVSALLGQFVSLAMPYLIGRIYFNDAKAQRELAIGMFIGGLLYVPLCLFEIRMSPKLHLIVYGFFARQNQVRFGGWRPNVFMDGGLQVGLWMTAASLAGIWLWWTGALKKVWGISAGLLLVILLATTVLCRSMEALVLLVGGLGILLCTFYTRNRLAIICLLLVTPAYIVLRTSGIWDGEQLVSVARLVDETRANSIAFRIKNEDMLIAKALQNPVFGWGGWGRSRVYDRWNNDISITDGRWVIELGQHGIAGTMACFASMLLPLAYLSSRIPTRRLLSRELAPPLVLALITTLYTVDCLPNSMANPVFVMLGGAVLGFALAPERFRDAAGQDERERGAVDRAPLRRLHPGSV